MGLCLKKLKNFKSGNVGAFRRDLAQKEENSLMLLLFCNKFCRSDA